MCMVKKREEAQLSSFKTEVRHCVNSSRVLVSSPKAIWPSLTWVSLWVSTDQIPF